MFLSQIAQFGLIVVLHKSYVPKADGCSVVPTTTPCIVGGIGIRGDKTQSIYEKPLHTNTVALYGFDIFKIGIDCPKKIIKKHMFHVEQSDFRRRFHVKREPPKSHCLVGFWRLFTLKIGIFVLSPCKILQ